MVQSILVTRLPASLFVIVMAMILILELSTKTVCDIAERKSIYTYINNEKITIINNPVALNQLNTIYNCNLSMYVNDTESFISFAGGYGNYFQGALVALFSLLKTCPTRPVSILLVNVTLSQAEMFLDIGVSKVFITPLIEWNLVSDSITESNRWKTWSKFQLWQLTEYRKLLYIDSDTLVLNNIDELFSLTADSDFSVCLNKGKDFNSGVMALSPNNEIYDDLITLSKIITKHTYCDTEQDILVALYFRRKRFFSCTQFNNFWFSWSPDQQNTTMSQSKIIHWAGLKKPWKSCSQKSKSNVIFWANSLWCNREEEIKELLLKE